MPAIEVGRVCVKQLRSRNRKEMRHNRRNGQEFCGYNRSQESYRSQKGRANIITSNPWQYKLRDTWRLR